MKVVNKMFVSQGFQLTQVIATRTLKWMALTERRRCRACGDFGHRTRECPGLTSGDAMEEEEMDAWSQMSETFIDQRAAERSRREGLRAIAAMDRYEERREEILRAATAKAKAKSAARSLAVDAMSSSAAWEVGSQEEITQYFDMASGEFLPTPQELEMLKKKREKKVEQAAKSQAKRGEKAALTGEQANYPSLSHCWSQEVALNLAASVKARMSTFLWKKMLWQLRVKKAVERTYPGATWKRNRRWLAILMGKEVAALWGHMGAMRKQMWTPKAWELM